MTQKQVIFLQAMLECSTISTAAKQAGISQNTATKYMKDPIFQSELNRLRSECLSSTVRYLQVNMTMCAEKIMEIVRNPDTADQVRINAINTVFQNCKSLIDTCEIEERIRQIEEMVKEQQNA